MINGLRSAIYPVADLAAAKAWYIQVFGVAPYFDEPFYVGFAVGGFELGLLPDGVPGTTGVQVYWGVDDIVAEAERITALGASTHTAIEDVGGDIRMVQLADPFGNVLGLIQNPHFDPAAMR
ncbi:VOC family protein [Pseudoduganella buxea]|uniref:Glyoxalase n=1 Tax=Pseudoduganella buxea TaxID=1949069 RepID=A0A6I3SW21_9BURK|nr:VOC family protein [Pseudoduganella buxea]MTV53461.1 VOC family protein [Pseudoduganella buxea]GGB95185.1 glyoxalase [Pseudoduganella buxea]